MFVGSLPSLPSLSCPCLPHFFFSFCFASLPPSPFGVFLPLFSSLFVVRSLCLSWSSRDLCFPLNLLHCVPSTLSNGRAGLADKMLRPRNWGHIRVSPSLRHFLLPRVHREPLQFSRVAGMTVKQEFVRRAAYHLSELEIQCPNAVGTRGWAVRSPIMSLSSSSMCVTPPSGPEPLQRPSELCLFAHRQAFRLLFRDLTFEGTVAWAPRSCLVSFEGDTVAFCFVCSSWLHFPCEAGLSLSSVC